MINIAHKVLPDESQMFLNHLLICGEYRHNVINKAKVISDPLISDEYLLTMIDQAKIIRDPLVSDEYLLLATEMEEIRELLISDN